MRYSASSSQTKENDAYRTISEVAHELDLAPHVLRFWETKFNMLKPLKRKGGRRFYRPEDITIIRTIKTLLYDEGMTIKGAAAVMKGDKTPANEKRAVARQMAMSSRDVMKELKAIHKLLA